jgi:glycosyltransferase involved in cell wall biosynthesis
MKVLMVTDFYPPFLGGVEVLVSTLSRELVKRGHDVAVATLAAPDLPSAEFDHGVRVHRVPTSSQRARFLFANGSRPWSPPAPDPEATAALRAVTRRERPDVVHGHDWLARSYLPLKRRNGPPLVMSLHYFTLSCPKKNLMYEEAPCTGPRLGKCLACAGRHYGRAKGAAVTLANYASARAEARLVDLFVPVSEATATGNALDAAHVPYVVVPNLIAEAAPRPTAAELLRSLPDEPFLLFVGDVRRDKVADVLLEAYTRMTDPPPLVLIGKVWPETPPIPTGVTLLRDWPNDAVREAMGRSIALVAPSVWAEPFGIVVAEAITAGRPVVASAIGGIPEIVRHEREALLVAPGDANALADALSRIAVEDILRDRLATNASLRARAYAPATVVPQFEAAYERAIGDRRARRSQGPL